MPRRRVPRARTLRRRKHLRARVATARRKRSFLRVRRMGQLTQVFRTARRRAKRRR